MVQTRYTGIIAAVFAFALCYVGGAETMASAVERVPLSRTTPVEPFDCLRCETVLHRFGAGLDGATPQGPLFSDSSGALYGTTTSGGKSACDCGTVFKLTPTAGGYVKETLHAFTGGFDGNAPTGGVLEDADGNLFGTTSLGGSSGGNCAPKGCGVVFELIPTGSKYTLIVLYSFLGGTDGSAPMGGLLFGPAGSLFGTTSDSGGGCGTVCGTAFELTPAGSTYTHSVIHNFNAGADGQGPRGTLIADANGDIFGTTPLGGDSSHCTACGTVFELVPGEGGYSERVVYRFKAGTDGKSPAPYLTADGTGNIYGATQSGGGFHCNSVGCGTIFKLSRTAQGFRESVVYGFRGQGDGQSPQGIAFDSTGTMFGTATVGGGYCDGGCGVIFEIASTAGGYKESVLYRFRGGLGDGAQPSAPPILGGGTLYGTTSLGGRENCFGIGCGIVFSFKPH